jgi:hypothetical protein
VTDRRTRETGTDDLVASIEDRVAVLTMKRPVPSLGADSIDVLRAAGLSEDEVAAVLGPANNSENGEEAGET